jgi:hypothetical protein
MKLKFTQKEFDKFRSFQDRMAKEFGDTAYVGTDYTTVLVEYSPELKRMLRPMPKLFCDEYELSQLVCEGCKTKRLFLSVPGETTFVCDNCVGKMKGKLNGKTKENEVDT